ncbi:MAG TPA: polysaccharide deacetylase family protein [Gemmatimonadales bacterium]
MTLLVSIHDVSPAFRPAVQRLWDMCARHAVVPALLVVPDWHGEWPLERHPDFAAWLRECARLGAEIVLHGERHDERGLPRGAGDALRAWGRTAREGEFLTLDEPAARERIERGAARLRAFGLPPVGFVPPAWLATEGGHRAVAAAGLGFSEDESAIHVHRAGRSVRSPVLRWSTRTRLRAIGSVAVARARWTLQARARYPRLALHPQDLSHPAVAGSLEPTLERWLARHDAGVYAEVLTAVTA